jgi:hypothetical protein
MLASEEVEGMDEDRGRRGFHPTVQPVTCHFSFQVCYQVAPSSACAYMALSDPATLLLSPSINVALKAFRPGSIPTLVYA